MYKDLKEKILWDFHGNAPNIDERYHGQLPKLTNKAAIFISENLKPGEYFKLGVQGGGCGGFEYSFESVTTVEEGDIMFSDSPPAITDKESLQFLYGSEVDLEDANMNKLLKVKNPGAQMSCGCGSSFNYDPNYLDTLLDQFALEEKNA